MHKIQLETSLIWLLNRVIVWFSYLMCCHIEVFCAAPTYFYIYKRLNNTSIILEFHSPRVNSCGPPEQQQTSPFKSSDSVFLPGIDRANIKWLKSNSLSSLEAMSQKYQAWNVCTLFSENRQRSEWLTDPIYVFHWWTNKDVASVCRLPWRSSKHHFIVFYFHEYFKVFVKGGYIDAPTYL